ncbi:MAG TPA: ROK family protein [Bryobacterales bacterium]|nr:ROK family protein [Bryobacterales bacterium]
MIPYGASTDRMSVVIGLDIGGTKLAGGVLAADARLLARRERPTRAAEGVDVSLGEVYGLLSELAAAAAEHGALAGIGICAPGPLNPETGFIFNPTNMPGWVNIPLAEEVSRRFGVPCRVENDANGAGLGEAVYGAGRGFRSVFYATISTGIGAGIILDGRVYHGKNGAAGEGGHVSIDYRSPVVCNCGSIGCIEALASGSAIARRARELACERPETKMLSIAGDASRITAEIVARAAAQGDPLAAHLIEETAEMLGAWLGSVVSLLDPDIIVIGGGVSKIGEPLFRKMRETMPRRTINPFASQTPIVSAQLQSDAGILGAAAVILSR